MTMPTRFSRTLYYCSSLTARQRSGTINARKVKYWSPIKETHPQHSVPRRYYEVRHDVHERPEPPTCPHHLGRPFYHRGFYCFWWVSAEQAHLHFCTKQKMKKTRINGRIRDPCTRRRLCSRTGSAHPITRIIYTRHDDLATIFRL